MIKKITITLLLLVCSGLLGCAIYAQKIPVLIDTDMGFDDWIGILYLLKNPNVSVKAITIDATGETYCRQGLEHARYLLSLVKAKHIPIRCGLSQPLKGNHVFPYQIREQSNSMNNIHTPTYSLTKDQLQPSASHLITQMINLYPHKLLIVALAPLTNIAQTFIRYPKIAHKIKRIYISGGAVNHLGDLNIPGYFKSANKWAEWNLYIDPYADHIVFHSDAPITLVALNSTGKVPVTDAFVNHLHNIMKTPAAKFVYSDLVRFKAVMGGSFKGAAFYDAVTSVVAINPNLAKLQQMILCVDDFKLHHLGQTYPCSQGKKMRVAMSVNVTGYNQALFKVIN